MTPKTLKALVEIHTDLHSPEGSKSTRVRKGYIDQVL